MATTQLPPGIYRIAVARGSGSTHELLTRESDSRVTILPPGAKPDPEQEVICRFLTSSIVCRSQALLVEHRPW